MREREDLIAEFIFWQEKEECVEQDCWFIATAIVDLKCELMFLEPPTDSF